MYWGSATAFKLTNGSNLSQQLPPALRHRHLSAYPPSAQVILRALKKYGMIVADNGSDWFLSGAPDARWSDAELNALRTVHGRDFEVVRMGTLEQ